MPSVLVVAVVVLVAVLAAGTIAAVGVIKAERRWRGVRRELERREP